MKFIKLKSDKRAQLFTIVVILILLLTFISLEVFSFFYKRNIVQTRISSMDNFLSSLEENLGRQMYISGFRILFLAENKITSSGNYINVDTFFNEAFFNGTVEGVPDDILIGATYSDILDSLNQKASKINVDVEMTEPYITITQEDPWFVKFTLTTNFTMEDKADLALWHKQQSISALIPVEGFEDPLYVTNTYAKVSRIINRTEYEGNYVSGTDVSNLLSHVNNGYYAANPSAPNFLKRLEGNTSADVNGIESFVNIPELSSQGIPAQSKSDIDYIYFSSDNPAYYNVAGMPSWFRIDTQDNHSVKYGVSGLLT